MNHRKLTAAALLSAGLLAFAPGGASAQVCVDDPARDELAAAYDTWLRALATESAELDPAQWRARQAEVAAAHAALEAAIAVASSHSDPMSLAHGTTQGERVTATLDASCRSRAG